MRHRSIALPLAVLAMFVATSVAVAGGWAQVKAENIPVDPPAGEATTINLNVLQHGVTPVSWPGLTVVATDATSGAVVRVAATASGPTGSYVARIVFPSAGQWTLAYDSADLDMEGKTTMRVAPPLAAAGGAGAPAAQALDVLPLALALLAAFAVLAVAGLAVRRRGAPAGTRVSART
jgi:hypothetical protein